VAALTVLVRRPKRTLAAEKKLSSGSKAKKLTSAEKKSLTSLRAKATKARTAALKKRKATSATATTKAATSLNAAAKRLQKKVDSVNKRLKQSSTTNKNVDVWAGFLCARGYSYYAYDPKLGWTLTAAIKDAKSHGCGVFYEIRQNGKKIQLY